MPPPDKTQPKMEARKVSPVPKTEPAEEWSFVNLSEPKQSKDESVRKFVRSNAMRDYRQKKRRDETKHHRKPADTTAAHGVPRSPPLPESTLPNQAQNNDNSDGFPSCGHAECVYGCRYSSRTVGSSPKQLLGDGGTDPFDALPIEGDSQYNCYILNHFDAVMARNFLPVMAGKGQHPLTNVWIPNAVADPLLFLATVNFAAAHLDFIHGRQTSSRTIAQKVETIRLINLRLPDSNKALSNSTIGAVAMLAAMESTTGNHRDLNLHMDGLVNMVRMRGGLQQLGWDGALQIFIIWQDLLSSATLSAPPHFPRPHYDLIIQCQIPLSTTICDQLGNSFEVCAETTNSYNDMRHLTDLLCTLNPPISHMERMHVDSVRNGLKHRFLSLNIRKPKGQMQALDYLLEACRIAALIFLNRAFHASWPSCPIIRQLKCQLKELLLEKESYITEDIPPQEHCGYYTWALFMGGVHSQKDEDIAFFAERIATSTQVWQAKGFTSWPEILHLLKRVGWINALQSPECDALGKHVDKSIRSNDAWDLAPEIPAHGCWPVQSNTLLSVWVSAAESNAVCRTSSSHERPPHTLPLLMAKFHV